MPCAKGGERRRLVRSRTEPLAAQAGLPLISSRGDPFAGPVRNKCMRSRLALVSLRLLGAGVLLATGAIHLDLYVTGYRTIPTIGWLFLLQVITAFLLAVAVLATVRWWVASAGALFALSTLAGYLLALRVGLFGFTEVPTAAGTVAATLDLVAFVTLAAASLGGLVRAGVRAGGTLARAASVSAVTIAASLLAALSLSSAPGAAATSAGGGAVTLERAMVGGAEVVTDARGYTLYWFAPDTPTASRCSGSCAAYWPPVIGSPRAGAGLPGKLATIRRRDGRRQASYAGHPLYRYVGDSRPGEANGNDVFLNGGEWHEMRVSRSMVGPKA